MSHTMIWFLCIPIALGLALWYGLRESRDSWKYASILTALGMFIVLVTFFASQGIATWDTEIWSGKITTKDRIHDSYVRTYPCNCRTVTTGSGQNASSTQVCDTCYEDRYTVEWSCNSTVGKFEIEKFDSANRSVYNSPDPARWTVVKVGEPASIGHRYTNYVQAVPQSLFSIAPEKMRQQFAPLIPAYPEVFDFYRVNRFFSPGFNVPDAAKWNDDISMMLRELGPSKQVNAIVVIAKTDDPNYEYALRDAWEGANKNDVVLIIGTTEWPKISFVRVLTWSKAEIFKIELRDSVLGLETIQREQIMSALNNQIIKNFERRRMREFKYLKSEIDPPTWALITLAMFLIIGAGVAFGSASGFFDRFKKSRYTRHRF